jgi:RHS repeat-associated protein
MATVSSSLGSETYIYDGDGHRVKKQSAGRLYWYGASGEVLAETGADGSNPTEYIFFDGKRIARRDSSGNVIYYLSDMLGSSRVVTDSNGNLLDDCDFLPYGEERCVASSSGNHYKFDGMERDSESGLDHTLHRQYASNYGRWLTPDPGGVKVVNLEDPQTWNLYSFVRDTPTTLTDPTGLQQEGSYQSRGTSTVCAQGTNHCNRSGDVVEANGHKVGNDAPAQNQKALDKVAMAAEKEALGLTRAALKQGHEVEYGGWLIQSNKDGSLSYTKPAKGEEGSLEIDKIPVPKGFTKIAEYHTHPYTTHEEGEGPSPGDVNRLRWVAHNEHVDRTGYVGNAFSGAVYRYTQWEPIRSMYDTRVYGTKIGTIPSE